MAISYCKCTLSGELVKKEYKGNNQTNLLIKHTQSTNITKSILCVCKDAISDKALMLKKGVLVVITGNLVFNEPNVTIFTEEISLVSIEKATNDDEYYLNENILDKAF